MASPAMMASEDKGVEVADDPVSLARTAVGNVCAEAVTSFDPAEQLADLLGSTVLPRDGSIALSDRPGLGLDFDERALERLISA